MKKILAFLMAVVMLFSMATISFADFKDSKDITKTEAVEILTTIGVLDGYTDGTFNPKGLVTRAEMAKMIATILNKGEDVGSMYAGACTFADSVNHWAAGYIAYCAQEGIINGKSEAVFAPDDYVTGTEAAKMVLGALGHDGDKANLVGNVWASNTLSLARKHNLVGDKYNMTANMNASLDRENAAQLLLNGLKATMVEYTGGTSIQIGDIILTQGATASDIANTASSYYGAADGKMQLVEDCFPKLTITNTVNPDLYGRAVTTWRFEGKEIGSYAVVPYKTYTTKVTLGDLYTDLGRYTEDKFVGGISYYVDGKADAGKLALIDSVALRSGNSNDFIGGQGTVTEVYFDEATMTLRICEINTYAGLVVTAAPAVKDANGDITIPAYVVLKNFDGSAINAVAGLDELGNPLPTANSIAAEGFSYFDRETAVYYTKGWNGTAPVIGSVAKAPSTTGVNNGYVSFAGQVTQVTIGNAVYNVNCTSTYAGGAFDQPETIYFDSFGNVIASTGVASQDYVYVMGAAAATSFTDEFQAQLLFTDGTVKIVDLAYTHKGGNGVVTSAISTYTVDAQGRYTLMPQATGTATQVDNKVPTINTAVADANTDFVVGVVDVVTHVTTYSTYTGIANVPSFTAANGTVVYAVNPLTSRIAAVFCVDATVMGTVSENVIALYKTGNESKISAGVGNEYYVVPAVVDNKVTTLNVGVAKYEQMADGYTLASGGTKDSNGNYVSFIPVAGPQFHTFTIFKPFDQGNVTLDTVTYIEATTPTIVWNLTTKTLNITTIDVIYDKAVNTTGYYTTAPVILGSQGAITAIYMIVNH